ncbi:hypothetical protein NLJ89_g6828 [Agrocybe chaxingu]|uniref:CBM1 domain-containing protein n=1 Tax=Agrocybe chaxingu TaxID=84603 RepID=A0A9W8MTQ1_9AGAR|nr:hypothetical protein NLJ89_g6828 [Agrocybe chaxingu]
MMIFRFSLVALALAVPTLAQQQQVWGQCGGNGWTGPTSCVSGTTCVKLNDWYFQCQPGGPATTAVPPPPPPATTAPPVSTPVSTPPTSPPATTTIGTTPPTAPGSCPSLPGTINLVANSKLPDPFKFINGTRTAGKNDWPAAARRSGQLRAR